MRIEGRTIAKSFWGQAWCANLERYSDYKNRLPRGRSYVRNGSVVDLQIGKGDVTAMVAGSDLYKIKVSIAPVAKARWKSICRDCAGSIDLLVELLQGRLAKGVMDRVCRGGDGLFPSPGEINLACSCPDWAEMCKHVSAVLYGIGARLDEKPQLLFVLRGVDENELIAGAGQDLPLSGETPGAAKVLSDTDVAALFGLEMADTAGSDSINAPKRRRPKVEDRQFGWPCRFQAAQTLQAREPKQAACRNDKTSGPKTPATGSTTPCAVNASQIARSAISLTSIRLVISTLMANALLHFLLTSAAVSPVPFSLISAQTTLAPSRAKISAMARPMPLAAPVIMMVFPAKSSVSSA